MQMPLNAAKTFLVRERLDWNRPHLRWLADTLYRNLRISYRS